MDYEEKTLLAKQIVTVLSEQGALVSEAIEILDIGQKIVKQSVVSRDCIDNFESWI